MPEKQHHILVTDDEASVRQTLEILLKKEGYQVSLAASAEEAFELVQSDSFDLILTDMRMEGMTGVDLLRKVKKVDEITEVIIMTAFANANDAVEAMKLGAYDYLIKPFNVEELKVLVERAIEKRTLGSENIRLKEHLTVRDTAGKLLFASEEMGRVYELIKRVADVNVTVLITGESGVGKEVVAQTIHYEGGRSGGPFIAVNCGALPENLIEAELFGYEKGSFTGADRAKAGLMEQANGGTLFLDEIGELPLLMQVKLLRVLQEQKVRRIGSHKEKELDVRIVAATNRDLDEQIKEGSFREDLYYRLNVMRIEIPPLRERPEDVEILTNVFVREAAKKMGLEVPSVIEPEVIAALQKFPFPGNVRELENVIERAMLLARDGAIEIECLPPEVANYRGKPRAEVGEITIDAGFPSFTEEFSIEDYIESIESNLYQQALDKTDGKRTEAATLLGISFRQFRYKAKKYDL